MIRRRHVYHVAGYDPIGAGWYRLFKRELGKFAQTWNVSSAVSDPAAQSEASVARWTVTTSGPNWQVETVYDLLLWDDIVLADFARPAAKRIVQSLFAFFNIVMTGTAFRYFGANWQYALFFLFPFLLLCTFALAAAAIAHWLASSLTVSFIVYVVLVIAFGAAIFTVLLHWPGQRWGVHQALDDWIFSRDYVYGRRPDVDARLDHFAETLVARARDPRLDEIVIVGHSMGATLALEMVT